MIARLAIAVAFIVAGNALAAKPALTAEQSKGRTLYNEDSTWRLLASDGTLIKEGMA